MNYRYIHIVLWFCVPIIGAAQSYTNTFTATGGVFGDGYGGEITLNSNLSETTFTQIGLEVSFADYQSGATTIPYSSFTMSYSYFITLFSRNRRMQTLSLGGGALAGYELVNNGDLDISNVVSVNGESKFIYGGVLTGDIDNILSEHISLIVRTS